jgi:hypothetical protein
VRRRVGEELLAGMAFQTLHVRTIIRSYFRPLRIKDGTRRSPQTVPSRLHLLHRTEGLGRAHLRISSDLVA